MRLKFKDTAGKGKNRVGTTLLVKLVNLTELCTMMRFVFCPLGGDNLLFKLCNLGLTLV